MSHLYHSLLISRYCKFGIDFIIDLLNIMLNIIVLNKHLPSECRFEFKRVKKDLLIEAIFLRNLRQLHALLKVYYSNSYMYKHHYYDFHRVQCNEPSPFALDNF